MAKINILAEGDSWFSMPGAPALLSALFSGVNVVTTDVLAQFVRIPSRYQLFKEGSRAHKGDTITEMVNHEADKNTLATDFEQAPESEPIRAMLFSGGGNDLLVQLPAILNQKDPQDPQKPYVNEKAFNGVKQEIQDGYRFFIKLCKDNNAKLISHTYYSPDLDYPPPHRDPDVDLKRKLTGKGYTDPEDWTEICRQLIEDRFVPLLNELKNEYPSDFDYVGVHELPLEDDRRDQIHLSLKGCKEVAQAFVDKLDEHFPPAEGTRPYVSPIRSGPSVGG